MKNIVSFTKCRVPIETERFSLRELTLKDKAWYKSQMSQSYFNSNIQNKISDKKSIENFLNTYFKVVNAYPNKCMQVRLVVEEKSSGALVGGVTIFLKRNISVIELGYWVIPVKQGTGIMSEILPKIANALSKNLDAQYSIQLEIFDSNGVQKSVAIKSGFEEMQRKAMDNNKSIVTYKYNSDKVGQSWRKQ